jgi:hypothetical protein
MPNKIAPLKAKPPPGQVQQPCPLEWRLEVEIQPEAGGPKPPEGKVIVVMTTLQTENRAERGGVVTHERKLGKNGTAPADHLKSGKGPYTFNLVAQTPDKKWRSVPEFKVELNPGKQDKRELLVTLAIAAERRLRLRFLCKDKPVAKMPWRLVYGKTELKGTTNDKGELEALLTDAFETAFVHDTRATANLSVILTVFANPEKTNPVWERARLRNLGLYPPDRVSPIEDEKNPDRQYQHALALGMFLEKERGFKAPATLEARKERHKLADLDDPKAGLGSLHRTHFDDEFAVESHLTSPHPLTYAHGPDAGDNPRGNPRGQGLLASFHQDYVFGGKFGCERNPAAAVDPVATARLSWEEHALAVEQATKDEKCAGVCKGEMVDGDKIECPDCQGLGIPPAINPVFDRVLRPHLFHCIQMCRDWNDVKERCLDGFTQAHEEAVKPSPAQEAAKKKNRNALMRALIAFRNHYIKSMVQEARNKGMKLVAQAVGSADLTSDFDVTLAGPDDLYVFAEANEQFRQAWKRESGVVLDTNFYFLREWLSVGNNIVKDASGKKDLPGDEYTQLEMDEQTSDLYSLAKIRRYTSKAEWAALRDAVYNGVELDGLKGKDIPLFGRFELVDQIYQEQYVKPLMTRLADFQKKWAAEARKHGPKQGEPDYEEFEETLTKGTARTLERLIHYDRNTVLRECNLAYLEIVALTRRAEAKILAAAEYRENPGVTLKRIRRETMRVSGAKMERPGSGLNAAGVYQRNRLCGKLFSEAHLFAAESYNTQASMKDVVAKQGKFRSELEFNVKEYLFGYNEQVGDGFKEIREYQRMVDEEVEFKKHLGHGPRHENPEDFIGVGFYRASKYEQRMTEVLKYMIIALAGPEQKKDAKDQLPALMPDACIKRRRDRWKELFPGQSAPDEKDLELLKKEYLLAQTWENALGKLLKIRKSQTPYDKLTLEQKRDEAKKIIAELVKPGGEFDKARSDAGRQPAKIEYKGKNDKPPKYTPQGEEWKLRHLTEYLLHHCAQVNKLVRRLLARAEIEMFVDLAP